MSHYIALVHVRISNDHYLIIYYKETQQLELRDKTGHSGTLAGRIAAVRGLRLLLKAVGL